jgi:hypothetical protein
MAQKETNTASLMENSLHTQRKPINFDPATFPMIAQFKKHSKPSARKSISVVPLGFTLVSAGSGNSYDAFWRCGKIYRQPWGEFRRYMILTRKDQTD